MDHNSSLLDAVELKLQELFSGLALNSEKSVGGGCINTCLKLETSKGNFFLKYNDDRLYPGMFEAEAKGLALLGNSGAITVPRTMASGKVKGQSYLLMQWIESGRRKPDFWSAFGNQLAALHRNSAPEFGLEHDNYIGSLTQSNRACNTWKEFFAERRINPQLRRAVDEKNLDKNIISAFDKLFARMDDLIPVETPSLVHGDLWSGNFMTGESGQPVLVDPAVYYGHREMDLAMTKLFGGFDPGFYQAYQDSFPLAKGFDKRVDIHNLYPLLVHVNLFGGGYAEQVKGILKRLI